MFRTCKIKQTITVYVLLTNASENNQKYLSFKEKL